MRRLLAAASISAILLIQAIPSAAAPSGRVVVFTVDGTRLRDWRAAGLPAVSAILREGASALLSTRTAENATDVDAMVQAVPDGGNPKLVNALAKGRYGIAFSTGKPQTKNARR